MPVPAVELEVGNRTVRVTSPDKIYFPEVGLSKLDADGSREPVAEPAAGAEVVAARPRDP